MEKHKLKIGDKVRLHGYNGTVVQYYYDMVEVRLPGGVCCVSESECEKIENTNN